jgi:amino acid transporter
VAAVPAVTLRRALGKWDLTAIGINQVIGSAIFILPSQVAAQLGGWSPLAFLLAGFASLLVALCFAEVGSRFDGTGGPYLYTRAAFGRFLGFEVGWMQWSTRVMAQASVVNGIALALGFFWPMVTTGAGRVSLIAAVTLGLGWINLRGIRQSAFVIDLLTIAKLVPLALFIVVGVWFIDWNRFPSPAPVSQTQLATGALLLIFAFGGYDVIGVPAGVAAEPRRHVPFAFVATIIAVTLVMTLAQIVAMGTLPNLPGSTTPLADASLLFMGAVGASLISAGSVASMAGNNVGQVLAGSRMLFALAEHGELPRFFGKIHPRYRTPSNAIIVTTLVTLGLALSGSFALLAVASAVARLITYMGTCAATLRLRHARVGSLVKPAAFVLPGGATVPVLAMAITLLILAGATGEQWLGGAIGLATGAALFIANDRFGARHRRWQPELPADRDVAHVGRLS